jgi:hypothetical protein
MPKHFNLSIKFANTSLRDADFQEDKKNILNFSENILKVICQELGIHFEGAKWQVLNYKIDNQGHFILADNKTNSTWDWLKENKKIGHLSISTDDLGTYDGGLVVFWYLYFTHLPDFECTLHINTYGSEPMYLRTEKEYPTELIQKIIEAIEKKIAQKDNSI